MDQESINLCKRLEGNMQTLQNNMSAVLHLLRGNELDDETGMINQLRSIKMDLLLRQKEDIENKKNLFEKMSQDKTIIENRIELVRLEFETKLRTEVLPKIEKFERWRIQVVALAVGVGVGAGIGLKSLIDLITK